MKKRILAITVLTAMMLSIAEASLTVFAEKIKENIPYISGFSQNVITSLSSIGKDDEVKEKNDSEITLMSAAETLEVSSVDELQSEHPYSNSIDTTWVYTHPSDADSLSITFSDDTETESDFDFIYIYDSNDNQIGKYSGTELAGQTIEVSGNVVKIQLTSDSSMTCNGFTVTNIDAVLSTGAITNLRCIARTKDSVTLSFPEPKESTSVTVEQSTDGAVWSSAITEETLADYSTTATVIGLEMDTQYYFRLNIVGGLKEGISNCICVITYESYTPEKYFEFSKGTIINYIGKDPCVVIPAEIRGISVESIDDFAFYDNDIIKKVILPRSITTIGEYAFAYSKADIIIEGNTIAVGSYAFDHCSNVIATDVSISTIGEYAFFYCGGKINLTILDTVQNIAKSSFECSTGLEKIVISSDVINIGKYAFSKCVADIVMSNNSVSVEEGAFWECSRLDFTNVTVTNIGVAAFSGASGRVEITFGNEMSNINPNVFRRYGGAGNIIIPQTVTSIESGAFDDCMADIEILSKTLEVGDYSFQNSFITTSEDLYLTKIGQRSFYSCSGSFNVIIGEDITHIPSETFEYSGLTSIKIKGDVTNIEEETFHACNYLVSVEINGSTKSIGKNSFSNCGNLTDLLLGESVTEIDDYAFYFCEKLNDFDMPKQLINIGNYSFAACYNLSEVIIPDSVTKIGIDAFVSCSGLEKVIIGNGVTDIGNYAFSSCSALKEVTLGNNISTIGIGAFYDSKSIEKIYYNVQNATNLSSNNDVFKCAGQNGNGIEVIFGKNVKSIPSYLFFPHSPSSYAPNIVSVTISDSVMSIGENAFYDCNGLENVYITDIAAWCDILFSGSSSNPLYYAHNLYLNGSLVTDLIIPNGVTSIGDYAFQSCGLTSVTIPDSMTSIGDYVFCECGSLTDVYYTGNEERWKAISIGSYNTCLTNAEIHYNCIILSDGTIIENVEPTLPKNENRNEYIDVEVYYNSGLLETTPIGEAKVNCSGTIKTTDVNGMVRFYKDEIGETYNLTATADGFFNYGHNYGSVESDVARLISATGKDYICMTPKDPEKIYITSLTASSKDKSYNLQANQSFTVDKTDNTEYTFKYTVDWNGYKEGKAYLRGANSGKMLEFANNELTIKPGRDFDAGENVVFIVYTDDNKRYATIENVVNIKILNDSYALVFKPIESDEVSKIPFLSGLKINMGFNNEEMQGLADEIKIEDDKLVLKFTGENKNKSEKEARIFNKYSTAVNLSGKLEVPLNDSADWSGEVAVKFDGQAKAEDYLSILDIDYNTMVVLVDIPIPVTASVTMKGALEGKIGVSGWLKNPNLYGTFTPSLGADVFGGLGQDYDTVEVKAGLYGALTGKLAGSAQTDDEHWDFAPSLEGSYGARASVKVWLIDLKGEFEAGNFKWSKDGFKASWLGDDISLFSLDSCYNGWQLSGREYLDNGGGFIGDSPQIELFDLDVSNKDERIIYENIFDNAEAVLQNIYGKKYLIYTIDDIEREQQNGLKLVYSVQNSDGTWSEPIAISDDGTLDSTVSASGQFAIWEDMKSQLSADTTDMRDILSRTEISVAQFNGAEWMSERLTNNNEFDFSPVIVSNGDTAMAAWLSNSEADFSAQSGKTSISYATYDGEQWSDAVTINDVGEVTRVTLDYNGTDGNIFYKKDDSLYVVSTTDNLTTELGYNEVGQYAIGNHNGETVLAYFDKNNKLQVITDVLGAKKQSSIELDTNVNSIPVIKSNGTDMYICWIDHQDGYDTLCGVRYEEDVWSEKITFVGDELNVSNPSLIVNDDGTFSASYFKTGKVEVQDDGNYITGTTNLYTNNIVPSYNLALNQKTLTYNDEAYLKAGVALLKFDLNNIGEKSIDGVDVEIYEGSDLIQTIEKDINFKAGETKNISVTYIPTEKNVVQDITIKAVPKNVADFDVNDNVGIITLGTVDMTVSNAYFTQESGQHYINAILNNNGSASTDRIDVQVHKDSINGDIVYETVVNDVLANEELFIKEPVNITGVKTNYFVTVSAENDIDDYNNFSMAVLDNSNPDFDFTVIRDDYNSVTSKLDLSINTVNNTGTGKTVQLIMAAYGMDGKLKKLIDNDITMLTGKNTIDTSFDCTNLPDNFIFKLFIWDSIDGMKPIGTNFKKVINIAD
ncbi:MAG: leucine-rich repeat protein [bacterium]|nr:leucine-rich repeat protein [bacterium]